MNVRQPVPKLPQPLGCLLSAAMIGAPFLALLYDLAAGLAVAAGGLLLTAFVTWDTARPATGRVRNRLLIAAAINAVIGLACLGVLALGVAR